jgi:prepilin-type N-terminal cleavage/methylation domain-containing protein
MQSTQNIKSYNSGFTILEISIVLVIVGLLVAGVLGGQEIIKSMKINGTIAQMNEITAAANSFKLKYDSLPGDMPDATDYWGATDTGELNGGSTFDDPCNLYNEQTKTTCNGNGSGLIGNSSGSSSESLIFWQHLKISEIYKKSNLPTSSVASDCLGGNNYCGVKTKLNDKVIINIQYQPEFSDIRDQLKKYKNMYMLAENVDMDSGVYFTNSITTAEDSYFIDSKIDDGMPTSGGVTTWDGSSGSCRDSSDPPKYDISNTSNKCGLAIVSGF